MYNLCLVFGFRGFSHQCVYDMFTTTDQKYNPEIRAKCRYILSVRKNASRG
jgi:hypothetical protein